MDDDVTVLTRRLVPCARSHRVELTGVAGMEPLLQHVLAVVWMDRVEPAETPMLLPILTRVGRPRGLGLDEGPRRIDGPVDRRGRLYQRSISALAQLQLPPRRELHLSQVRLEHRLRALPGDRPQELAVGFRPIPLVGEPDAHRADDLVRGGERDRGEGATEPEAFLGLDDRREGGRELRPRSHPDADARSDGLGERRGRLQVQRMPGLDHLRRVAARRGDLERAVGADPDDDGGDAAERDDALLGEHLGHVLLRLRGRDRVRDGLQPFGAFARELRLATGAPLGLVQARPLERLTALTSECLEQDRVVLAQAVANVERECERSDRSFIDQDRQGDGGSDGSARERRRDEREALRQIGRRLDDDDLPGADRLTRGRRQVRREAVPPLQRSLAVAP